MVSDVIRANPKEVTAYLEGKTGLLNWLFGQVMRSAKGKANPQVVRAELTRQLSNLKDQTA